MNISHLKTLIKSQIMEYVVSPVTYIFVVIFLILTGVFTFIIGRFFEAGDASLQGFFFWHPWIYLLLVPAIGMNLWATERRLGTLELLFTMPITPLECIVSKFVAAWTIIGVALLFTAPMVITVYYLGNPDPGPMITGYIGSFLMAGAFLAISSFSSALTRSPVISFITSVFICMTLTLIGLEQVTNIFVDMVPKAIIDTAYASSILMHFSSLQRGVIDTQDLVYFISIICGGLFFTGVVLKNHRAG